MTDFVLEQPVQIEGSAVFARNRSLRMQLRRWWVERPKRWAAWLMLNPSDAGEKRNDPTMLRVVHFTRNWARGFADEAGTGSTRQNGGRDPRVPPERQGKKTAQAKEGDEGETLTWYSALSSLGSAA